MANVRNRDVRNYVIRMIKWRRSSYGWACNRHGEEKNEYKVRFLNFKGKHHLGGLNIDGQVKLT
jgi:hypothetical protein